MKYTNFVVRALLVIFIISFGIDAYCQKSGSTVKVKTMIIYEEKTNALLSKKLKDTEITYDLHGNILEETYYKEGKVIKHFKYEYDSNDNKIREEEYDPSGKLKETSEYKYDNNLRIEKIVYDPQKNIKLKKTYTYSVY
jgi:hypothetical protein